MNGRITKREVSQQSAMPLPEAGKIKIGEKVKNAKGTEYPTSLDYFRPTGAFSEMFKKQFGEKPQKLMIVFISDDFNQSCQERYECWQNGKRYGWGDGTDYTVWDAKSGKDGKGDYVNVKAGDSRLNGLKWDEMVTMRFLLPEMKGVLGFWSFSTKGKKTIIPALVNAFDFVRERMGTVVGCPFELIVEKAKGYTPGEARQYSKVKIVPCISEAYMETVKEFIGAGKKMVEIAPLMVSEAKLLAAAGNVPDMPAVEVEIETEAVEVTESNGNGKKLSDFLDAPVTAENLHFVKELLKSTAIEHGSNPQFIEIKGKLMTKFFIKEEELK